MSSLTRYSQLQYDTVVSSLPPRRTPPSSTPNSQGRVLVVLDDDPTGTQTVHNVAVLTTFDKELLKRQLETKEPGFFILTNSRAYHDTEASELLKVLLNALREAAEETSIPIEIVLRSDSTLRGHFPLEPELTELILGPFDAWLLAPAFIEGGRVTINNVHYVREGSSLVPVGDTPFASDRGFGFKSSNLKDWISEKFNSRNVPAIETISIEELRQKDAPQRIADRLKEIASRRGPRTVIVLNSFEHSDIEVFVAALNEAGTINLLYRTGASFVSARLGIANIPPISAKEIFLSSEAGSGTGGLIIIGSYVPKTTLQRQYLLERCQAHVSHFELSVDGLLQSQDANDILISKIAYSAGEELKAGKDVVVSTSRGLVASHEAKESLRIGVIVSNVLVNITKHITVRPKYVIAKGGITSSDIATKALGMEKARVMGQAAVGVPLWKSETGEKGKWPNIPYIVFPGNVGTTETLGYLVHSYRN